MRLRVQFEKLGAIRFTSHRDVMRIFQRCLASAGTPVSFTEGFHPHMRMSFGPPLRTGWESEAEFMDIHVDSPPGQFAEQCNERLPAGIRITHVSLLPESAPKLAADISAATYEIFVQAEDAYGAGDSHAPLERSERVAAVRDELREHASSIGSGDDMPRVLELGARDGADGLEVVYTSTMLSGRVVAPADLLEPVVGDPAHFKTSMHVRRKAQFVLRDGEYVSPVSKGAFEKRS